jgi:hypothetical protein
VQPWTTLKTTLATLACAALTACGGGGGGGDDSGGGGGGGGGSNPPPTAADCSALATGRYSLINPFALSQADRVSTLTIDTTAGTARDGAGTPIAYTPKGGCAYEIDEGDYLDTVMVSSGSVLTLHATAKSSATTPQRFVAMALPEQTQQLADWQGTWQVAGWIPGSVGFTAQAGEITFDGSGNATSFVACPGTAACGASGPPVRLRTSSLSSTYLDFLETSNPVGRAYLYKNSAGDSVFVIMTTGATDRRLLVGTKKRALGALPAVGTATGLRQFTLEGPGSISTLVDDTATVTAVDAGTNAFTQSYASGRVETLRSDFPREGTRYRAANACGATACPEFVQVPLQGMGMTLSLGTSTSAASAFFTVAVNKP